MTKGLGLGVSIQPFCWGWGMAQQAVRGWRMFQIGPLYFAWRW